MPRYICLFCGHEFETREENPRGLVKCGKCTNYWCIPKEKHEKMISELMEVCNDNTPALDLFNGLKQVWANNGLTGRPLKTLEIAVKLVEEAERRKKTAKRGEL